MASGSSKWSRKRSKDEIDRDLSTSPSSDSGNTKRDWKVKSLDEILAEKEKRRKLDLDSPVLDEESSHSRISSATSSPALALDDSKTPSINQTPTQEVIYQLSPEHNSSLSSSSETSRQKSRGKSKKGRRKTEEEEGEIFSDISDSEPHGSKPKSRRSSRHVSTDVEMTEKITTPVTGQTKDEIHEEIPEKSDISSDDDNEQPTKQAERSAEEESSEEKSSDSSEESDSSEDDEEEENAEEKDATEKVENKASETSEEESEDDSDDSDSDDSEDSDTSDDEEENKTETTIATDSKKALKADEIDSKAKMVENASVKSQSEVTEKHKEKYQPSKEPSNRHQKTEQRRDGERPSRQERQDRAVHSREKRENKSLREDIERTSRKHKSTSESSDHKKLKESKRTDKDRVERSRERPEKQVKEEYKKKERDSKSSSTSKAAKVSSKVKESKSSSKQDVKSSSKQTMAPKLLTDEERMQFVAYDSEDDKSDDDMDQDSAGDDLNVSEAKEEEEEEKPKPDLPDYLPAIQGCRNVSEEFVWLNRIEEGTYGVVYRARDKRTDEIVALKGLKMAKEKEGFPITSLREINTLLKGQHPNIVTVREVVVGGNMDKIFIVMDYVEHDLKTLMEHMSNKFAIGEVKTLLVQLLRAVAHLHDNWILHRDLKTSNLLLSNKGILKVADFGLAREYGSPLKPYTPIVVTLWYRAPELLLGIKEYSCPIDMWSVGCIFAELLTMKSLFPGKSEIDQINKIFKDLGTPSDKIWPGPPSYSELPHVKKMTFTEYPYNQLRNKFGTYLTDKGFDLLNKFLTYDPRKRITAEEALKHDYFNESPYPVKPDMFPTWPAKSEMMKRPKKRDYEHSPKPPEGGEMFAKLKEGGDSSGGVSGAQGFHMLSSKKGSAAVAGFSLKF